MITITCILCGGTWEADVPEQYSSEAANIPCPDCVNNKERMVIMQHIIKYMSDFLALYFR